MSAAAMRSARGRPIAARTRAQGRIVEQPTQLTVEDQSVIGAPAISSEVMDSPTWLRLMVWPAVSSSWRAAR